jgi:hypothetical protein
MGKSEKLREESIDPRILSGNNSSWVIGSYTAIN